MSDACPHMAHHERIWQDTCAYKSQTSKKSVGCRVFSRTRATWAARTRCRKTLFLFVWWCGSLRLAHGAPVILKLHEPPKRRRRPSAVKTGETTTSGPSTPRILVPAEEDTVSNGSDGLVEVEPDEADTDADVDDDKEISVGDERRLVKGREREVSKSTSGKRAISPFLTRAAKPRQSAEEENFPAAIPWKFALVWLGNLRPPLFLPAAGVALAAAAYRSEPMRRAAYFWRRGGPMILHYKFTQWWLNTQYASNRHKRDQVYTALHDKYCSTALDLILNLKGLYIKIGQVLCSRPDFMPPQYLAMFETVLDAIPQWDVELVRDILSRSFEQEFGLAFGDVFEYMDGTALGSASIGQVHRAVLKDEWAQRPGYSGGKVVAVKVMHPGAKERFSHDFEVFHWLCRLFLPEWKALLDELERRMMTEFDYRSEAASLAEVRQNLARSPYNSQVCIPEPLEDLCCKQVLVMENLNGEKLINAIEDDLAKAFGKHETAIKFLEARKQEVLTGKGDSGSLLGNVGFFGKLKLLSLVKKCRRYVKLLVDVHGKQILVDGCFNGDPHFGNVLRLDDGRLGLIDYGQTKRLSDTERLGLAKVIAALGQDETDSHNIAKAMRELGFRTEVEHDDAVMVKYAKIFFDSDQDGKDLGFASPQLYFASLMGKNKLTRIPDAASK